MKRLFKLPLMLVLALLIAMLLLKAALPFGQIKFAYLDWLSLIVLVLAMGVVLSAAYAFRRAQTTFDPRTPEKTSSLVITGIFHLSRNPMYLGFLLILIAAAIYSGQLVNFLLLPLFVALANRWYIQPEEAALTQLFGQDYLNYLQQVRRWI